MGVTNCFRQRQLRDFLPSCGSIWYLAKTSTTCYEFGGASSVPLTGDDLDAGFVTSRDHVLVLRPGAALGGECVGDGLVIGPPLRALDVLLRRAH